MHETPEDSPPAFLFPGDSTGGRADGGRHHDELADGWRRARHGTWRVAVAEESMAPALAPGDWLLLDPTCDCWPRRGSIVVFREPDSDLLAIKRVAARPGDRVRIAAGVLHLALDEAWLLGDNAAVSLDSRRYGPVPLDALVGRAWYRYAPGSRIGRISAAFQPGAASLRAGTALPTGWIGHHLRSLRSKSLRLR